MEMKEGKMMKEKEKETLFVVYVCVNTIFFFREEVALVWEREENTKNNGNTPCADGRVSGTSLARW